MNVNIPAPPTLKTLTLFWAVGKNHSDLEQSRGTLDLAARHFFTCPPEGVQVFGCSSPVFLFSREESFLSMRKPLPEMELFFSSHFQPARRANGRPSCIVHRLIRGTPMAMVGACRKVVVPSRRTLEHVDFEPQHLFFGAGSGDGSDRSCISLRCRTSTDQFQKPLTSQHWKTMPMDQNFKWGGKHLPNCRCMNIPSQRLDTEKPRPPQGFTNTN